MKFLNYLRYKKLIYKEYKQHGSKSYNTSLKIINTAYALGQVTYKQRNKLIACLGTQDNQNWWR